MLRDRKGRRAFRVFKAYRVSRVPTALMVLRGLMEPTVSLVLTVPKDHPEPMVLPASMELPDQLVPPDLPVPTDRRDPKAHPVYWASIPGRSRWLERSLANT